MQLLRCTDAVSTVQRYNPPTHTGPVHEGAIHFLNSCWYNLMFDARSCITVNEAADTIARTAIIQGIFMSFVLNLDFRIAFICVF